MIKTILFVVLISCGGTPPCNENGPNEHGPCRTTTPSNPESFSADAGTTFQVDSGPGGVTTRITPFKEISR